MAPRKSATSAGDGDGPTLTLIMEKGPLSGQRNDFRPGSLVRIGRLVRGNTLSIKDSGVSSKHLLIQFHAASDPETHSWTITDLGSSNGTILNGAHLDPSEPAALSDGDVIKIGEQTSIRVNFEVKMSENKIETSSGNVRRNTRRRVRGDNAVDLLVIKEDSELNLQNGEEIEKLAVVNEKQGRSVSTRRTRNSAKNEKLANDLNVVDDINLGQSGIRGSRGVSTRRTRNSRKDEMVDGIEVDVSAIEGKKTRRGGRGRERQCEVTISKEREKEEATEGVAEGNEEAPNPENKTCEEDEESEIRVDELGIKVNISGEGVAEGNKKTPNLEHKTHAEDEKRSEVRVDELGAKAKNSGAEEVAAGSSGDRKCKGKMVLDLSKMSLGEWLDYLEVHEPQEIIDRTEEMLAEMRRKAEICHEFRLQHKNTEVVEE